MYHIAKLYQNEQKELESKGEEIFSRQFFDKALLNFMSELGMLYRKLGQKPNRKELMQAYVTGFKGMLAIGVALHCKEDINEPEIGADRPYGDAVFFDLYEKCNILYYTLKDAQFYSLFSSYLALGKMLGLNFDDIYYVYYEEKESL